MVFLRIIFEKRVDKTKRYSYNALESEKMFASVSANKIYKDFDKPLFDGITHSKESKF